METEVPPRHGCLTAYLVFMLIMNTFTCLVYLFTGSKIMAAYPAAPAFMPYVLAAGCALNIVIALYLFWWRKWAFYLFCVLAVIVLGINIFIGINPVGALTGLIGPLILYGVLQIGGEKKGWKYLK
jgi:hypothetical protein